jgi:hypothetical protein
MCVEKSAKTQSTPWLSRLLPAVMATITKDFRDFTSTLDSGQKGTPLLLNEHNHKYKTHPRIY